MSAVNGRGRPAGSWNAFAFWPSDVPQAREYWIVLRSETPGVPPATLAPTVAQSIATTLAEGRRRGARIAGVQFDVDSPTGALAQYAEFLATAHRTLPPGVQISITALLDWFRPGTAVDDVLRSVDEFVPQFYDVRDRQGGSVIAAPIDAARWGPVFNRYKRRFRIGVSSFGRSRISSPRQQWFQAEGISPLDFAADRSFKLSTSVTDANETVLRYSATRPSRIGYNRFEPGDSIEFTLPTRDGMRNAVQRVKKMGGWCAGVVFFRWPSFNETVTALPEDVLAAAGAGTGASPPAVQAVSGGCAAVYCADLYLVNARPLSPAPARYHIQSSTELEYLLPREGMPVRMSGSADIEIALPPYCGRSRIYLGRVVTRDAAEFHLVNE
jgi:hypothetical protein